MHSTDNLERVRAIIAVDATTALLIGASVTEKSLILIERHKPNLPMYVVYPGGAIDETDKTPEEALKREVYEELGIHVEVGERLFVHDRQAYYICKPTGGKFGTGTGPEFTRPWQTSGTYTVRLITLKKAAALHKNGVIKPEEVTERVLQHLG